MPDPLMTWTTTRDGCSIGITVTSDAQIIRIHSEKGDAVDIVELTIPPSRIPRMDWKVVKFYVIESSAFILNSLGEIWRAPLFSFSSSKDDGADNTSDHKKRDWIVLDTHIVDFYLDESSLILIYDYNFLAYWSLKDFLLLGKAGFQPKALLDIKLSDHRVNIMAVGPRADEWRAIILQQIDEPHKIVLRRVNLKEMKHIGPEFLPIQFALRIIQTVFCSSDTVYLLMYNYELHQVTIPNSSNPLIGHFSVKSLPRLGYFLLKCSNNILGVLSDKRWRAINTETNLLVFDAPVNLSIEFAKSHIALKNDKQLIRSRYLLQISVLSRDCYLNEKLSVLNLPSPHTNTALSPTHINLEKAPKNLKEYCGMLQQFVDLQVEDGSNPFESLHKQLIETNGEPSVLSVKFLTKYYNSENFDTEKIAHIDAIVSSIVRRLYNTIYLIIKYQTLILPNMTNVRIMRLKYNRYQPDPEKCPPTTEKLFESELLRLAHAELEYFQYFRITLLPEWSFANVIRNKYPENLKELTASARADDDLTNRVKTLRLSWSTNERSVLTAPWFTPRWNPSTQPKKKILKPTSQDS